MEHIKNAITAAGYVPIDLLVAKVQEKLGTDIPRRIIDKAFREIRDAEKAVKVEAPDSGGPAAAAA